VSTNINPFSPARRRTVFVKEDEDALGIVKHVPSASFSPISQVLGSKGEIFDPEVQVSPKYSKYRSEFEEKEVIQNLI
jgi:hypothetical protein